MPEQKTKKRRVNPTDRFREIAEYLILKYSIRYNELRAAPEIYQEKTDQFIEIDEYTYNSIFFELKAQGYIISDQILHKVVASNLVPKVNPLKEYFQKLPAWDGHDYIKDLAGTITLDRAGEEVMDMHMLWERLLQKFLVSMIATALSDKPGQVCLVLVGGQGVGKSTWLNNLLPQSLKKTFLFTGGIIPKITDKSTADLLSEKLLIHLDDQMESYKAHDYEGLKSIITSTRITTRKIYQRNDISRLRRATFVASTNNPTFLVDTHNRRYLVFTVRDIDKTEQVDRDKVFSQAYHLYMNGEAYWLNEAEQKQLNIINARYRLPPPEEDLVEKFYTPGGDGIPGTEWLMTTEIKMFLENQSGQKNLSIQALSKALQAANFTQKSVRTKGSTSRYRWGVIQQL